MGEPKACPFCGATSISVIEGSTYRWLIARCDECGAQAPDVRVKTMGDGTKEEWKAAAHREAIAAWNERTEPSRAAEGDSVAKPPEGVGTGAVVVPMEMISFLCGESQLDGLWFGEYKMKNGRRASYWWRTNLREAIAAAPAQPSARGGTNRHAVVLP